MIVSRGIGLGMEAMVRRQGSTAVVDSHHVLTLGFLQVLDILQLLLIPGELIAS